MRCYRCGRKKGAGGGGGQGGHGSSASVVVVEDLGFGGRRSGWVASGDAICILCSLSLVALMFGECVMLAALSSLA